MKQIISVMASSFLFCSISLMGVETDKWYEPYQKKADKLMSAAGYSEKDWITIKYEGHNHSERSWSNRLGVPFKFLLGR